MIIGKEKALEIYFKAQKKAPETVERIAKWDSSKNYKENAADLGIDYHLAYHLCSRFKLSKLN